MQLRWAIGFFAGNIVISCFLTLRYALPCGRLILQIVEKAAVSDGKEPTEKIKSTIKYLKIFLREMRNNNITNTLQNLAFMFFPFMWSKMSYNIVFGWTIAWFAMTCMLVMIKFPPDAKRTSKILAQQMKNVDAHMSTANNSGGSSGASSAASSRAFSSGVSDVSCVAMSTASSCASVVEEADSAPTAPPIQVVGLML